MEYTFHEMPDLDGTGQRKVYPKATHCSRVKHRYFMEHMTANRGISKQTVELAVAALVDELTNYLSIGHSVKIDGLGVFGIRLGMERGTKAETVKPGGERYNTNDVILKGITFKADPSWVRRIERISPPTKAEGIRKLHQPKTLPEERLKMAIRYIEENTYMKVRDYQEITQLRHSMACKELREFAQREGSGIRAVGKGNMLMYMKETPTEEAQP